MIVFKKTNSEDPDFTRLVSLLDADLKRRDGDDHVFYAAFNKIANLKHVIVCYKEGFAVGCGAFKGSAEKKAEIKRMFVEPEYRGNGLASGILRELENWASSLGYATCILETGKNQPEAIGMYQKAGYRLTENYGQYVNVDNSVCMAKNIK